MEDEVNVCRVVVRTKLPRCHMQGKLYTVLASGIVVSKRRPLSVLEQASSFSLYSTFVLHLRINQRSASTSTSPSCHPPKFALALLSAITSLRPIRHHVLPRLKHPRMYATSAIIVRSMLTPIPSPTHHLAPRRRPRIRRRPGIPRIHQLSLRQALHPHIQHQPPIQPDCAARYPPRNRPCARARPGLAPRDWRWV